MNKVKEGIIIKFLDNYAFLGNMYKCRIPYLGIEYSSVENAYQAQKTMCRETRKAFVNLDPFEAKKLGREIKLRNDWEIVKLSIMEDLVNIKFRYNEELRDKLILTFPMTIIADDMTQGDNTFWGKQHGEGKNNLGKILMKVREEFIFKEIV